MFHQPRLDLDDDLRRAALVDGLEGAQVGVQAEVAAPGAPAADRLDPAGVLEGFDQRQLRGLIREIDDLANKLENNPAGYLLGREEPEEFEP